jgi:hypothetical protein
MAQQIQLRNDLAATWTSNNPTLAVGEMGIETDTDKFKLGDGATAWTSLGYGGIKGVVAATSPVTYNSGTSTVGIDQTAINITTSQISDITSTAAELNILDGVTATSAELNFVDGVTSGIQSQLDDKALLTPAVNAKTAAYTLAVGDRGETITADGTFTLTAPSATFSAGDRVDVVNIGTGVITFAGSGVTINPTDTLTIESQWSAASILFLSGTTAVLIGDIA